MSIIKPQVGYQETFLSTSADIAIGGGAAGVGKTFSLLIEPVRHAHVQNFEAVTFRRTNPQIRNAGGLWDASQELYTQLGPSPKETTLTWDWSGKAKFKFGQLEYEKNIYDWQGTEICFLGFDELTHFSEKMFFYMLSRNRSTCGVSPYVRATCNPDPDSWLSSFIDWWIDPESGYPIKERDGKLRYYFKVGRKFMWGDSKEEVNEQCSDSLGAMVETAAKHGTMIDYNDLIKSVTFVGGSIYQNKELLQKNPEYLANLSSLDEKERAQLLDGNWKIRLGGDEIYDYDKFKAMYYQPCPNKNATRYITSDVAFLGSDLFILCLWVGKHWEDVLIVPRCDGSEAITLLRTFVVSNSVQGNKVLFDADGVGQGLTGHISGSIEFHNGAKALNDENYQNLKTQCFYKSAEAVRMGEYTIDEKVVNYTYKKGGEYYKLGDELLRQQRAIKRAKADYDGKKKINGKEEQKEILGCSPDLIEPFAYREYFELEKPFELCII